MVDNVYRHYHIEQFSYQWPQLPDTHDANEGITLQ